MRLSLSLEKVRTYSLSRAMQLQVLPRLKEKISIERARMRLKSVLPKTLPQEAAANLRDMLSSKEAKIESEDTSGTQVKLLSPLQDTLWGGVPFSTSKE